MAGLLNEVKVDGNYGSTTNFKLPKGALDNIPDDLKEAVATALKQSEKAEQAQKAGQVPNGNGIPSGVLVTTSQPEDDITKSSSIETKPPPKPIRPGRPLQDQILNTMGIVLCPTFSLLAYYVWENYPLAPKVPSPRPNVFYLLGAFLTGIAPLLATLQILAVGMNIGLPFLGRKSSTSVSLMYTGVVGYFIIILGRVLSEGWPLPWFNKLAVFSYTLALSNAAIWGPIGLFDKWHAPLFFNMVVWCAALGFFLTGAWCVVRLGAGDGPQSWDWFLGWWWEYIVKDSPILLCSLERFYVCTGWTHACPRALAAVLSPQCPRCPYTIKGQGPCSVAMQATLDDHRTLAYGIMNLLGLTLAILAICSVWSFITMVKRMMRAPPTAADFKPGYWLACDDIVKLQKALLPDVDSKVNDPVAYDIMLEHIVHVKGCYQKPPAEQASVLKGQQRWHYTVVNAGESNSSGYHWGVGVWDGRQNPNAALIVDPYPSPTAFQKAVPYGRQRQIQVQLVGAGKQKCTWRCGYFSLWWVLWLDLQPGPTTVLDDEAQELANSLPAMPDEFPGLCWALLGYMTQKNVQLKVNPEFRDQVAKGVINMTELQASEVPKTV
uniref:Uncharacterized protein n=1 Tax=Eutreptiella gymnastica TaxID=73025 RepID=A0A7S1JC32_9EUGL|mmetsp:Transcript_81437/g.143614  ORF Transcript_81437/g.143614 Transcript_81437/m.143614 type:complete len:606 (+) Transcript_81437:30-1847(+)